MESVFKFEKQLQLPLLSQSARNAQNTNKLQSGKNLMKPGAFLLQVMTDTIFYNL